MPIKCARRSRIAACCGAAQMVLGCSRSALTSEQGAALAAAEDRWKRSGIRDYTFEFPTRVIAKLLGLPADDLPTFRRRAVLVIDPGNFYVRGVDQYRQMRLTRDFTGADDANGEGPCGSSHVICNIDRLV